MSFLDEVQLSIIREGEGKYFVINNDVVHNASVILATMISPEDEVKKRRTYKELYYASISVMSEKYNEDEEALDEYQKRSLLSFYEKMDLNTISDLYHCVPISSESSSLRIMLQRQLNAASACIRLIAGSELCPGEYGIRSSAELYFSQLPKNAKKIKITTMFNNEDHWKTYKSSTPLALTVFALAHVNHNKGSGIEDNAETYTIEEILAALNNHYKQRQVFSMLGSILHDVVTVVPQKQADSSNPIFRKEELWQPKYPDEWWDGRPRDSARVLDFEQHKQSSSWKKYLKKHLKPKS